MTGIWKIVKAWFSRLAGSPDHTATAPPAARSGVRGRPAEPVRSAAGPTRQSPTARRPRGETRPGTGERTPHPPAHVPSAARRLVYAPQLDGQADPGEIVWTWVAYEDDPRQGKDRPVLVVGRAGDTLFGLMLSSRSERDGQRHWFALGPGGWDRESRPSWVRLDRVLDMAEDGIRREGAILDRRRFEAVAHALRAGYGWT